MADVRARSQDDRFDVVTLGESMVQLTPRVGDTLETATDVTVSTGGAESNVAQHLGRVGRRVAWVSAVGDDALGRRILSDVSGSGVNISHVRVDPEAPTGVYFKDPRRNAPTRICYYRSGSAASGMTPDAIDAEALRRPRVVHLSGITPALSASCFDLVETAIARAHEDSALVSFDVNYRPPLWPLAQASTALLDLARVSDLVFVGRDEAEVLWGTTTVSDVRDLIGEGPHLVVKDGAVGATSFAPGREPLFLEAPSVDVVEPVGAGDAFAAGYLHALLADAPDPGRLAAAHRFASAALSVVHDVGLPLPLIPATTT